MAAEPDWEHDYSADPDYSADHDAWHGGEQGEELRARLAPDDRQLGQLVGLLSLGLGLAEVLAPRAVGRAVGVGDHPQIIRLLGVRGIVTGLGMLSQRAPGNWAWARVAGDAMDLALLGAAASTPDADPRRIAAATAGVLGVAALDAYAGQRLTSSHSVEGPRIAVIHTANIDSTPGEVYRFWRRLENLPRFLSHLESVATVSDRVSHWAASAPAGAGVEWDAEIVDDQPGRRIGWRTLPGSQVTHEGMVSFESAIGGRSTVLRIEMLYLPPVGKVGTRIARSFGADPAAQIADDLRRLERLLETGEVVLKP
jgi:uncharacterized membrane protein